MSPTITNAGDATLQGAELEVSFTPVDNLCLKAFVGYLDAQYDDLSVRALVSGITEDDALPNTPEWQYGLSVGYDAAVVRHAVRTGVGSRLSVREVARQVIPGRARRPDTSPNGCGIGSAVDVAVVSGLGALEAANVVPRRICLSNQAAFRSRYIARATLGGGCPLFTGGKSW